MMNLYVREMTEADKKAVQHIYTVGWQNAFTGIVPQDYPIRLRQFKIDSLLLLC